MAAARDRRKVSSNRGLTVPSEDRKKQSKKVGSYLRHLHLGTQFFVSVGLFTFLGYWLDTEIDTVPLFTLLGLAIGFTAGFYALYTELFPSGGRRKSESGTSSSDSRSNRAENDGGNGNSGKSRSSDGNGGD